MTHYYTSDGTQQELSKEYQHNRVNIVLSYICTSVPWTKVALVMKGLISHLVAGQLLLSQEAVLLLLVVAACKEYKQLSIQLQMKPCTIKAIDLLDNNNIICKSVIVRCRHV